MTATATKGATAKSGTSNLTSARFIKKEMSTYDLTEWVVFEKSSDGTVKSPRVYPSNASRDNVRVSYSNHTGANFAQTRAVRVNTYKNRLKKSK